MAKKSSSTGKDRIGVGGGSTQTATPAAIKITSSTSINSSTSSSSVSLSTWTKNLLCPQKKTPNNTSSTNEDESIYKLLSIVLIAPFVLFTVVVLFDTETYNTQSSFGMNSNHHHHQQSNNNIDNNSPYHPSHLFAEARSTATVGYPNSMMYTNQNSFENKPVLCPDGYTYGYKDWSSLYLAIQEANEYTSYYDTIISPTDVIDDDYTKTTTTAHHHPDYDNDMKHFIICPGITLTSKRNKKGGIYINTEDILIECEACIVNIPETHFSFGPNAKDVIIRGITFMGASTSSLTFHYHGSSVIFEDCIWVGNAGFGSAGAVADLNSTSSVSFFRCEISDSKQLPRAVGYGNTAMSSSLTIRN